MANERLTHSWLAAHRRCPRLAYYLYVLMYRSLRTAHALLFGTAMHKCLEAYWRGRQRGASEKELRDAVLGQIAKDMDPYDRAKLGAMMVGYMIAWNTRDVKVVYVEEQFQTPLRNPYDPTKTHELFFSGGKIDVGLVLDDGRNAVMEHKSTAKSAAPGTIYRERLIIDGQVDQYLAGSGATGFPADTVIYDVVCKPKSKPKMATPEEKREMVVDHEATAAARELVPPFPGSTKEELAAKLAAELAKIEHDNPLRDGETKAFYKSRLSPLVFDAKKRHAEHKEAMKAAQKARMDEVIVRRLAAGQRDRDERPVEYFNRLCRDIAAAPDKFYQIVEVPRSSAERKAYAFDVWSWADTIQRTIETGVAPRNPDACDRYNSLCEFWKVCTSQAALDDPYLFRKANTKHEELVEDETEEEAA